MELHLFIIWEKGRCFEKQIEQDIRQHFNVLQIIDIQWSDEITTQNFTRFYGVNLPVGINKKEQCGGGEFRLIIVQDAKPKYDIRDTSHGKESVNIHTFDAKVKYRQWIGGPGRVHATNNPHEFNHDITLLLGINTIDYQNKIHQLKPYIKIQRDIEGAHGWESLNQLFYVLNNTIIYVILRGSQGLEKKHFNDIHRDCDFLVDNVTNAQLIINGNLLVGPTRPHVSVTIKGFTYYFDLWGCDKSYFDIQWCKNMFTSRKEKNGYYILDRTNNFYCLLYHCLIIKGYFSDDYFSRIEKYQKTYINNFKGYPEVLVEFLRQNQYEIVSFDGNGAGFHTENPIINRYYNKYGNVINKSCCIQKDINTGRNLSWKSCVYDSGDNIVKAGTNWLMENEVMFLKKLAKSGVVPQIKDIKEKENETLIFINKIPGLSLNHFFSTKTNYHGKVIRNIVHQIFDILQLLKSNNIIHRDFTGANILIDDSGKVFVIDFGWAIDITQLESGIPHPELLAKPYCSPQGYSDFYTIGMALREIENNRLPYLKRFCKKVCNILWNDYFDPRSYSQKIKEIELAVYSPFSPKDYFYLFLFRHHHIKSYYYKIRRKAFSLLK